MERERKIIDVHAHILPGVDDGARSMEQSCRMLQMAVRQGITAVIATPHYSRRKELSQLPQLVGQLQEQIRKSYPDFTVYPGQETCYHEGLPERLREGKAWTLAGSSYVLVEFEETASYEELLRGIRALMNAGYRAVLAHMERYPCLRREGAMRELSGNGCVFQMNYESLQGKGILTDKEVYWCRRQVRNGRISLLGTDMHDLERRSPDIRKAMRWLESHVEEELLDDMIFRNPLHIINDEGID